MLTEIERKQLFDQLATVRGRVNFVCDLLNATLMETSIMPDNNVRTDRETDLVNAITSFEKSVEYFTKNYKIHSLKK